MDLYFFDKSLDQITTVPLTSTPAGILVRKNINLTNADINVVETTDNKNTFALQMNLRGQEGLGHMTVVFDKKPVKLNSWSVVDATGATTDVVFNGLKEKTNFDEIDISKQTLINLPPRIRMATLYAVSQSVNGRVSNNCNLSEDWCGYSTRYGDSVGDFSPLSKLTVTEVKAVGYELGLPQEFIEKTPSDGLCGKTDEDNLGFTYAVLDNYIRTGICNDPSTKARIDELHRKNLFKLEPMPCFRYDDPILGGNDHE